MFVKFAKYTSTANNNIYYIENFNKIKTYNLNLESMDINKTKIYNNCKNSTK